MCIYCTVASLCYVHVPTVYINYFFLCFFLSKLLIQLKQIGHSVDKVEYIVMGGTFMALDDDYKDYFIRNLHDALSGHTSSSVQEAVK